MLRVFWLFYNKIIFVVFFSHIFLLIIIYKFFINFCFLVILNKIFNGYSIEKGGICGIEIRQLLQFLRDFKITTEFTEINQPKIYIIFCKIVNQKKAANLKDFIEIIYKIAKIVIKEKLLVFKTFVGDYIIPVYKDLQKEIINLKIEKIQAFYDNYIAKENPIANLLFENNTLFKHVKIKNKNEIKLL